MKAITQIIFSILVITNLTSCTTQASLDTQGEVIHLFEAEDIPTLDPNQATDPISINTLSNTMEGLVMKGQNPGEIVAGIAKSYSYDELTYTWTFKLNPEAQWVNHLGEAQRAVRADDFVYAWDRILHHAYPYAFMLSDVAKIKDYEALDDLSLRVTLSENVPYFLSILTFPSTYPIPSEMMSDKYATSAESTWYTGPYYLSHWTHGSQFVWTKNQEYWDQEVVKTPAISWRIIESYEPATGIELYDSGEIDRVPLTGEFVTQRQDDPDAHTLAGTAIYYLMFNIANSKIENGAPVLDDTAGNSLLDNKKIRQAIAYQIDKSYIADVILNDGSKAAYGFVPSGYLSNNGNPYESLRGDGYMLMDKEKAALLFEEGMQELGYQKGNNNLSIDIINYESLNEKLIIEYVKQELDTLFKDYGIEITISPLPLAEKLTRYQAGDYETTFSRWFPDYDWPTTYLDKWLSNNAYNLIGYSNENYDQLLSPDDKTVDQAFYDLQQAEAILLEDAVIVPIFQAGSIYLQNPNLSGIIHYLSGYTSSYKWALKTQNP
jgi:oligopeptide transport system substrate-binding protein